MPIMLEKLIKEETLYEKQPHNLEDFYSKVPVILEKLFLQIHDDMKQQKFDINLR